MVQSNEVIALVLATGVLVFLFAYRARLRKIPLVSLLLGGFYSMYAALVLTILEGFFWSGALNLAEHVFNVASVVLLVLWLWRVSRRKGGGLWSL